MEALHESAICLVPPVAASPVGVGGGVAAGGAVAAVCVADSGPLPAGLTARTAYQRLWPSPRPDSVKLVPVGSASGVPLALIPPTVSAANTWYLVALATSGHERAICLVPPVAVSTTWAGSVNALASGEAGPVPAELVAATT